jgi:diguanylate cyclase (GGDEF)-like protein
MVRFHDVLSRFGKLSVFKQACLIVLAAIIGADTLTLIFYGIFFQDRLILDLVLTTVITIAVGFPLGYFFMGQQAKLAAMAAELDRIARVDELTKLANRKAFFEEAHSLIGSHPPSTETGALLFIDADHFKSINDTFGHSTGDLVLRQFGEVIRSCIREGDLAARLGGEEFAVFLVGADRHEARQVAERMRGKVLGIMPAVGMEGRKVTASIGMCMCRPGQKLEDILLLADRNLYAAKSQGRNCVVDKEPAADRLEHMQWNRRTGTDPVWGSHG